MKRRVDKTLWFAVCGIVLLQGCRQFGLLDKITHAYRTVTSRYEARLERNPRNDSLRYELAQFYYAFRDYDRVKTLLRGFAKEDAQRLLANAHVRTGEHTCALALYERSGAGSDDETLYLYARACEEKNLFSRALALYEKTGGKFRAKARERILRIRSKTEDHPPENVIDLLEREKEFIDRYREHPVIVLYSDESMTVSSDGRSTFMIHRIQKIMNEKGKNEAEIRIGYDSTYETVELEYARTVTPEGRVIYAGEEHRRDTAKYAHYPLYSNARALIVSMPAVEIGAVIEYKVKIRASKLIAGGNFSLFYRLYEAFPVAQARFTLSVPPAFSVFFDPCHEPAAAGRSLLPEKTPQPGGVRYRWEYRCLPPLLPEERMPPLADVVPAVHISTFSSWEQIYQWWSGLIEGKFSLTPEMERLVSERAPATLPPRERVKALYEFCARQIRYVGVEYGESGYEPHAAAEVFENRYGDCKDKAVLLTALLREAGFEAAPVLIPTREQYPLNREFPSVDFNHAIALVRIDGKEIYMDPTASTVSWGDLPLDDQNRNVLICARDSYRFGKTPLRSENRMRYRTEIMFTPEEQARFTRALTATGNFAAYQRFYLEYTHPQKVEEDIRKQILELSPFATLTGYTVENKENLSKPPVIRYSFYAPAVLQSAGRMRILSLPDDIKIDTGFAGKEARRFPVEFKGLFRKFSEVSVSLSDGMKVLSAPKNVRVDTPWFVFASETERSGKVFRIVREFRVKTTHVPVDRYKEFKQRLAEVYAFLRAGIILEKTEKDGGEKKEKF
ncbi:MAG: DUF3857 domain-containing protein [Candidatus Omnitrophica bacterium]|nr:DUF3857 domain-containing protein [Candidatus Omnitrophota bacterium]